jgi:hypothetical protein
VKYTIISQVYTIIAFGASILLSILSTGMLLTPSAEGRPLYSIHPYFTAKLLLMLSTVIVWIVTLPIFLYSLVKGKIPKTRSTTQNSFIVSLALATIVVAISGSIFFSKTVSYTASQADNLRMAGFGPVDPFARVYGLGILFCEGLWTAWTIFIDGPEILGKRASARASDAVGAAGHIR